MDFENFSLSAFESVGWFTHKNNLTRGGHDRLLHFQNIFSFQWENGKRFPT